METTAEAELSSDSVARLILVLAVDRSSTASASAPSRARSAVEAELLEWRMSALCDTATLLTSELVTNAYYAIIRNRVPPLCTIRLVMYPTDVGVRLEVTDPVDIALPQPRRPQDTEESGRGLYLLDALASVWGWRRVAGGKTVWAEIGGQPDAPSPEFERGLVFDVDTVEAI